MYLGNPTEKYDGRPLVSGGRGGFGQWYGGHFRTFLRKWLRGSYWSLARLCFILKQKHLLCKINEGEGGKADLSTFQWEDFQVRYSG